jgi:hypothetical protein
MSGWGEPISVVEDLDPEQEPSPGRLQLRELVVGLVLLLGVLGFAGWQWWSHEARQSSYNLAVEAQLRYDLDQARALFARASGYKDADGRVADLDRRIARRNSLYAAATTHISADNWVAALADLRALHEIQPNYSNSAALEPTAVARLTDRTLASAVVLRDAPGSSEGLYYRKGSTWVYLPKSDADSRIRGTSTDGRLVYDIEVQDKPKRKLVLADFTRTELSLNPLPFDLELYQVFTLNENGLWVFRYGRNSTTSTPVLRAMNGAEVVYMPYSSYVTQTVSLANNDGGADGEVVVEVDPTSDRYLIASWTGAGQRSGQSIWSRAVLSSTITSLYVGTPGGERRLIYSVTGAGIVGAQLSYDGQYALVATYTPTWGGVVYMGEVYRLLLIDLQTGAEPVLLEGVRAHATGNIDMSWPWITCTFIESGAYAGKLLAAAFDNGHSNLRLYDPKLPGEPVLDFEVPMTDALFWVIARSDDRGLLLSGLPASYSPSPGTNETQTVAVVEISASGQVTQTGVVVDRESSPWLVDLASGQLALVCTAYGPTKLTSSVYSASASSLGQPFVHPTVVFTHSVTDTSTVRDLPPLNAYNGLLTYIKGDALHVRTYDGKVDVVLEQGISAYYPHRYVREHYQYLR